MKNVKLKVNHVRNGRPAFSFKEKGAKLEQMSVRSKI
jgi:hypothetical protein